MIRIKNSNWRPPAGRAGIRKSAIRMRGFTLLESIVATAVFAVAMTSIAGVFLSLQRIYGTNSSLQALQQNARFVSEDITKTIRNGRIDYDSYSCSIFPNTVCQPYVADLYLRDTDNLLHRIYKPDGEEYLQVVKILGTSQLTGSEVRVLNFRVYIWPPCDPSGFICGFLYDEQPTVTVFFELESNLNSRDKIRMPFQITAATRQYDF